MIIINGVCNLFNVKDDDYYDGMTLGEPEQLETPLFSRPVNATTKDKPKPHDKMDN